MPIYEYQCKKCGKDFEVEQRMADEALSTHDGCGGDLVKVFSSAGIVLKGSGFYKTDTRSPSKDPSSSTKPDSTKSQTSSQTSNSEPKAKPDKTSNTTKDSTK